MALNAKKALCIGNNDYCDNTLKLKYAVNDAEAISSKLVELGFEVDLKRNLDGSAMATVIGDTIDALDDYDVFLFYYAGHGCQIKGANYLIPTDAMWSDGTHAFEYTCISLSSVIMEKLKKYTNVIKIVILDACRQFHDASRGIGSRDFAPFSSPADSIIALSTSPGCVAMESDLSCHGRYTDVLLRYIDMPHVNIETIFKRVRQDMMVETHGEQIPWEHTSLVKDFKMNPHYVSDGMQYSSGVFENEYRCIAPNARSLVEDLRNGDFNIENAAVSRANNVLMTNISSDDVFYIGRSIFYAAVTGYGPSFSAQSYIRSFDRTYGIDQSVKEHLLNGMAYESYFGGNGRVPSTRRYGVGRELRMCVFYLLEKDNYSKCREFMANELSKITDRPVFIPGDERIQFSVTIGNDWLVESINYDGKTVLSYEGEHLSADNIKDYSSPTRIEDIKEKLSRALNASRSCIDLVFNCEVPQDKELLFLTWDFDLTY